LSPLDNTIAKQIIFGNRYTNPTLDYQINSYRVNTIVGNDYTIYGVTGPIEDPIYTQLDQFQADVSGWIVFNIEPQIILAGDRFDLVALVVEPAGTPTTFVGNWDYDTPNNAAIPPAGVAVQGNTTAGIISFSYLDNDGGDRTAELQSLDVGDKINLHDVTWVIQTKGEEATYINFSIAPIIQSAPDGIAEFTFETVVATPITFLDDPDYWLTSQYNGEVYGIFGVDIPYQDIIIDDSAYGVDINAVNIRQSPDWEAVAVAENVSGSSFSKSLSEQVLLTENFTDQLPTGLGVSLQIIYGAPLTNQYFDVDAAGAITCIKEGQYTVRIKMTIGRRSTPGIAQIYTRFLLNGTQFGSSSHIIMDTDDFEIPSTHEATAVLQAGDIITTEIIRDTDGDDSGGAYAGVPDVVGWNSSPSAFMTITRQYLA
jgi:hypothetical protein